MSKANLLKHTVTCKRLLVPKDPPSLVHAWCTWGNSSPYTTCRGRGSLRFPSHTIPLQVSITHHLSPGFLVLEVLSPAQAAASPAPAACREGEEKLPRVVMCASSPPAPSIPGILSNTSHRFLIEWGRMLLQFYLIRRVSYWSLLFYGQFTMKSCGRQDVRVVQEEPSPCQQVELSLSWGCWQVWPATPLPDSHSRAPGEYPCWSPCPVCPLGHPSSEALLEEINEINGFDLQYFPLPFCDRYALRGIF